MKAVVQRVTEASVTVDGETIASIGRGLIALIGFEPADGEQQRAWLLRKLVELRVFEDDAGRMNRSLQDLREAGEEAALLLVPNFTVAGDCRKGRRPSFDTAMPPGPASEAFAALLGDAAALAVPVSAGRFGADMRVALVNDGPVTLLLMNDLGV